MSIYCNRFIEKATYVSAAVAFLLLSVCCFQAYAGQPDTEARGITIVLDPGHGGDLDLGAKGPDGTIEKNVTLKLAGIIAAELENRFNVILTRMEDSQLDIPERTSVANHFKADLFISIHAGGGFVHKTRGISICYFADNSQDAMDVVNELKTDSITPGRNHISQPEAEYGRKLKKTEGNSDSPVVWEKIQIKHELLSADFADIVKKNLSGIITNSDIKMSSANYAVLEGADMPAILIEAGCLTNPDDEKALSGKEYPAALVKGLSLAIDEYFQNIGLQEKIKRGN
ncbi:MAG: N-acetylmuramoyl-L-alanine amidase [Desulfobacteraceae bacterium]|nr:MAG: N-acetylmuramoyl-L-alanine amidase [Desulfobacteraceae bacterium]